MKMKQSKYETSAPEGIAKTTFQGNFRLCLQNPLACRTPQSSSNLVAEPPGPPPGLGPPRFPFPLPRGPRPGSAPAAVPPVKPKGD